MIYLGTFACMSILFKFIWGFWIYGFTVFHQIWKILSHCIFKYFLCLPSLSDSSKRPILCMLDCLIYYTSHRGSLNSFQFFSPCFILVWVYCFVFRFTDVFILQCSVSPIQQYLNFIYCFNLQQFRFSNIFSFSPHYLHVFS